MQTTLHILNGEALLDSFHKSGVNGSVVVWNEVLVEGPVRGEFGTEQFLDHREEFIRNEYGDEDYAIKFRAPFSLLQDFSNYDEIVLWFEYDLFCQVNMIAALGWLSKQQDLPPVGLVCPGSFPGYEPFSGLGQLSPEELTTLYEPRKRLSGDDLDFALRAWECYSSADPEAITGLLASGFPDSFPFLKRSFELHLRRFPDIKTGLNYHEEQICELMNEGITEQKDIMRTLLNENLEWGFGDLQYEKEIENIRHLSQETPEVTDHSRERRERWIGGLFEADYFWDGEKKMLVPARG